MSTRSTFPRYALTQLQAALDDTPVVLIHGSRQCGKSTLARMAGDAYAYVTFDDAGVFAAAKRDPQGFVLGLPDRVILDEVQRVPELFVAIKLSVDSNRKNGRFILTGSSNVLLLPRLSDSLAGRMAIIQLFPLAQCELSGKASSLFDRMFASDFTGAKGKRLGHELRKKVFAGGYPEPLLRKNPERVKRWYGDYIRSLIERDITDISQISKTSAIPRLLTMLANNSAQLVNINGLSNAFQLTRPTIESYVNLLRQIFLVEFLQPWYSNRNSRLIKTPKAHLSDTGLACAVLHLTADALKSPNDLYGHLLETFVYMELRKMASWRSYEPRFYHFRDKDNYEVDIVIEDRSHLIGIEVKATETVRDGDFKGLRRLQRQVGKKMKTGILFYDGAFVLPFGDGMLAVPTNLLWE